MGLLIKANGEKETIIPKEGEHYTLKELQGYVGGYVERVDMFNGSAMYVDKDGRAKNLPYNTFSTKVLMKLGALPCDYIRGNALIVRNEEEE